jgi:tRNA dimethylallyltransferase
MTADRIEGRLVLIAGPTGVGKSEVAVGLAERWMGEIVSADSRALYRGMDIGTAKPTVDQRDRVPHHLLDVADPRHPWTMAEYRTSALAAITSIHARGRLPFLVGGTGQYVTALLEGWEPPPRPSSEAGRRSLEALAAREGPPALHRRLARVSRPSRSSQCSARDSPPGDRPNRRPPAE